MAKLYYGSDTAPVTLPDRLLGYIKVITATKLRRGESFTLTWSGADDETGRSTIWLQPSIPLRFVFDSPEPEQLSGDYLRALADQSNSATGLNVDVRTWEAAEEAARTPARTSASASPSRPSTRPVRAA
jgi:outer membrane translocation and assembly module TamA